MYWTQIGQEQLVPALGRLGFKSQLYFFFFFMVAALAPESGVSLGKSL